MNEKKETASETEANAKEKQRLLLRKKRRSSRGMTDNFFIIPDDDTKTLTICTSGKRGGTIKLDKERACVLANIIRHQIQKW